jgi:N-acetyl-gamma-glutamyl-phosphate reductase
VHKVFIDGQVGTTGLQIHDLLSNRTDLQLQEIPEQDRKNQSVKQALINDSDLVILCLPDDAARESVSLATNPDVKILDASTAHRVHQGWIYGLPELNSGQRDLIRTSTRVSNPGCYPTGFLLAVAPLVQAGIIPRTAALTISAISGFSGGGRKMIESYTARNANPEEQPWMVRPYGLNLDHKHLPEMQYFASLENTPLFLPTVGNYRQGMLVQVPVFKQHLAVESAAELIHQTWLQVFVNEPCIKLYPINDTTELDNGMLDPEANNGSNGLDLFLFESELHCLLIARLDNLGKGAAGAAVQNMNLMLGCDELCGLSF